MSADARVTITLSDGTTFRAKLTDEQARRLAHRIEAPVERTLGPGSRIGRG